MAIEFTLLLSLITLFIASSWITRNNRTEEVKPKSRVLIVPSRPELRNTQKPILVKEQRTVKSVQDKHLEKQIKLSATTKSADQTVKQLDSGFRWYDIPDLKFSCINAPDMSSYNPFKSIVDKNQATDKQETAQDRFLPHITKKLEEVSLDSKTFNWGKLFVKPDAVFYDRDKNEYLVVEYKTRSFKSLQSLTPLAVFQLLISAEVVKKHIFRRSEAGDKRKTMKVRSFVRLENKVVEVRNWQAMIQHVLAMLPEVLAAKKQETLSASELARCFILFDKAFKFWPENKEDAIYLGNIKHARIIKTQTPFTRINNKGSNRRKPDNNAANSTTCPC